MAVTLLTSIFNTTSGSKSPSAATPAVGDLIVIITAHTGNTSSAAPTDNNADGLGTYSLVSTAQKASNADTMRGWIRDAFIGSATSTTFTHNPGTSSGGGLWVFKVTGMSRKSAAALLHQAVQNNQAAATPAVAMGQAVDTISQLIGAVFNATNPATMTPPSSWTERNDAGYSTPTTGGEVATRDSGETGSTITWGSASASAFCAMVLELDTRNTVQVTQSVPDASLTATAKAVASLSASQSVPDASQLTYVETYVHTISPRARAQPRVLRTSRPYSQFALGSSGAVSHVTVAQSVPDASQSASAAVVVKAQATQSVADASTTTTAGVTVKAQATQSVPDAALSAGASAVMSLSSTQSVPDASQSATIAARVSATAAQQVPDAGMSASAGVVASLSSTQSVPDAALSAIVSTQGGLQAFQNVPSPTQSASLAAFDSLSAAQQVPDAAQTATARGIVGAAVAQSVPDASLTASVVHTSTSNPRARHRVLSRTSRVPPRVSYASNAAQLQAAQQVPDATLSASASVRVSASATQQVPDVAQTASVARIAQLQAAQQVPDATLSASIITANGTSHGSFFGYVVSGRKSVIVWRGAEWVPPAASLTASQQVPDAVVVTGVSVVVAAQAAQQVPDAAASSAAAVRVSAQSAQQVPAAAQSAALAAVASASSVQAVPPVGQVAQAGVTVALSAAQQVPDAALLAIATGNTSQSHIIVNQQVPDAALAAQVVTVNRILVAQQVPAPAQSAALLTVAVLSSAQQVPNVATTAGLAALVSASVAQQVEAVAQSATAFSSIRALSAVQLVPDASLSAVVTAKGWGKPTRMRFTNRVQGGIKLSWKP